MDKIMNEILEKEKEKAERNRDISIKIKIRDQTLPLELFVFQSMQFYLACSAYQDIVTKIKHKYNALNFRLTNQVMK